MVLNRNPDNFFAETEQVAFHTANVVPGIDFTNDPLLQFRNFSYLDTQLIRLGGPNFAQLPINRPVAEVRNQPARRLRTARDPAGPHPATYKNSIGGGCPALADENVFRHYTERMDGQAMRKRAKSFENHYSQARMFWQSMSPVEAEHIVAAFAFELGKVEVPEIRSAVVEQLARVDGELAAQVAAKLGLPEPPEEPVDDEVAASPALSQDRCPRHHRFAQDRRAGRRWCRRRWDATLHRADGQRGALVEVLAPVAGGTLEGGSGGELPSTDRSRRWRRSSTTPSWWRADRGPCRPCPTTATPCTS